MPVPRRITRTSHRPVIAARSKSIVRTLSATRLSETLRGLSMRTCRVIQVDFQPRDKPTVG